MLSNSPAMSSMLSDRVLCVASAERARELRRHTTCSVFLGISGSISAGHLPSSQREGLGAYFHLIEQPIDGV